MADAREMVNEHLEMLGSRRADFRHLSEEERDTVARRVTIHLSRASIDGNHEAGNDKELFFHKLGNAGISYTESLNIWRVVTRGYVTMQDIEDAYNE